jgi:hypothetical protein
MKSQKICRGVSLGPTCSSVVFGWCCKVTVLRYLIATQPCPSATESPQCFLAYGLSSESPWGGKDTSTSFSDGNPHHVTSIRRFQWYQWLVNQLCHLIWTLAYMTREDLGLLVRLITSQMGCLTFNIRARIAIKHMGQSRSEQIANKSYLSASKCSWWMSPRFEDIIYQQYIPILAFKSSRTSTSWSSISTQKMTGLITHVETALGKLENGPQMLSTFPKAPSGRRQIRSTRETLKQRLTT